MARPARPDEKPQRAVQNRTIDVRRRILEAAVEVLLEFGYSGASTVRIQERAGVTRGRLLHHFPSRDSLLIAATQHLATIRMEELTTRRPWPTDPAERIDAAIDAIALTFTQGYFWAATELWIAARTHEDLRTALLPGERALARQIRAGTDGFFGADLSSRPGYADLREVIFTSMRGMALTASFDPRPGPTARHVDRLKRLARSALL